MSGVYVIRVYFLLAHEYPVFPYHLFKRLSFPHVSSLLKISWPSICGFVSGIWNRDTYTSFMPSTLLLTLIFPVWYPECLWTTALCREKSPVFLLGFSFVLTLKTLLHFWSPNMCGIFLHQVILCDTSWLIRTLSTKDSIRFHMLRAQPQKTDPLLQMSMTKSKHPGYPQSLSDTATNQRFPLPPPLGFDILLKHLGEFRKILTYIYEFIEGLWTARWRDPQTGSWGDPMQKFLSHGVWAHHPPRYRYLFTNMEALWAPYYWNFFI